MNEPRWVHVKGDCLAYSGRCLLVDVIMWPDADADYSDIYDGREATSGRKFCRVESATQTTRHLRFSPGIPFDVGLYVDAKDASVETTLAFIPL